MAKPISRRDLITNVIVGSVGVTTLTVAASAPAFAARAATSVGPLESWLLSTAKF